MSRVVLIFPPEADPTQPHLSLPSLTAVLRQNGHEVIQYDFNILFYQWMLSKKVLRDAYHTLLAKLINLKDPAIASCEEVIEKSFPSAIQHIDEAVGIQRDPKAFYHLEKFRWAASVIRTAQALYKLSYYPEIQLPPDCLGTVADIVEYTSNNESNPYLSYLSRKAVPLILDDDPALVGISITYRSQFIPALTLASLLNEHERKFHLTVGGAFTTLFDEEWRRNRGIFSLFDSVVLYEGEQSILELAQYLESHKSLSSVPNLVYRDGNGIRSNPVAYIADINSLPTPDYDGLPIKSYLSPEFVPLLAASRGCYWRKCAFCAASMATGQCYRERKMELVLEDITKLSKKYRMRYFFLVDDSVTPTRIAQIASGLLEKGPKLEWMCHARMDTRFPKETWELIARGGCRYLILGLESASQRVLNLMNKGTRLVAIEEMLNHCSEAGIGVNLQAFIGFPSETEEEARATINFVLSHRDVVSSVGFGTFKLLKYSRVFADPKRYGVSNVHIPPPGILATEFGYEAEQGLTNDQAKEICDASRAQMRQAYPVATLLHTALGAHGLLYLGHHKVQSLNHLIWRDGENRARTK